MKIEWEEVSRLGGIFYISVVGGGRVGVGL